MSSQGGLPLCVFPQSTSTFHQHCQTVKKKIPSGWKIINNYCKPMKEFKNDNWVVPSFTMGAIIPKIIFILTCDSKLVEHS